MRRPIKFRAWDATGYMSKPFTLHDIQKGKIRFTFDCPVMQFTGLTDRNGVEIYEGDVVRCSRGCPHVIEFMKEVPSSNIGGMPGFYLSSLNEGYAWTGEEEVIGNIYQNPELLKGGNPA